MPEPRPAYRAWQRYRPSLRDRITLWIARPGWQPPEWVAMAEEQHRALLDRIYPRKKTTDE